MSDVARPSMGATARVIADAPERAFAVLDEHERVLTRFRPDSELCRLNDDPRPVVPASPVMRAFVAAARAAAERTGGLVDATLLGPLERLGYDASRADWPRGMLAPALAAAPERRPARPSRAAAWRSLAAGPGVVARAPAVRLDSGGIGKGLAADAALAALGAVDRALVDCGGDIALTAPAGEPWEVGVEHPLTGAAVHAFRLHRGGIATSGVNRRLWPAGGGYAHHLLDPATGEPAWTGVLAATALAPTAVLAETLAKAAVLAGPEAGARLLAAYGGLLFDDRGEPRLVAAELRSAA
jgi:thiamine biosynthesis lipoprotein